MSLVVITYNESKNIQRCISSAPFVDECLVVDSHSSDDTVDIAQSLGAKVLQEKWRGFGMQKAFAVSRAKNDWVLCLDADEALSPELASEIKNEFPTLSPEVGYRFPRISKYLGRWICYGGWYPDYQLRLFHRKHGQWNEAPIHEKVNISKTQNFKNPIQHFVFAGISEQVNANNRYSTLQAEEYVQKGGEFSWFYFFIKPVSKWFECYLIKRGFLDGFPGFVIAVGAAYSVFIRWVKIWELKRNRT